MENKYSVDENINNVLIPWHINTIKYRLEPGTVVLYVLRVKDS